MSSRGYVIHLLVLCAIQLLVMNHLHLGAYFYVNVYVLAIYILPRQVKGIPLLLVGFALGLLMDLAQQSVGIHAAAATLVAYVRPYLLRSINEDTEEYAQMGQRMLDFRWFLRYSLLLTFVFHLVVVGLEAFSFRMFSTTLLRVVWSTLASEVFIVLYYLIGLKQVSK